MAKRFKLKFPSMNIPSFQFCRLKSASSLPRNPQPKNYRLSPVNPKAIDISYPASLPAPPPSTPDYSFVISSSTRIKSDCCRLCRSRSCGEHSVSGSSTEFPCCNTKRSSFETREKFYFKQKKYKETNKTKQSVFKTEEDDDEDDSLVLLDSSRSFSDDHRGPISHSVASNDAVRERSRRSTERKPAENARKRDEGSGERRTSETASRREREPEGKKVRESFAVVKKSEDPYEDFKRSMLEMIMGKQMFEASDLEELLQCFLTLNSRQYHGVIVEAFSEIWEILFSDSHVKHRLSF
ncbi:hypothetical protein L484_021187 [Morus notabilis]|uniref:Transcription repressor n=1 Tax=Morus notabilis TaxID=981085 RepID=W9RST7_9ROSA|nr:transcription repressor OFP8 [Morus notabilis]EXC07280.1 hypothetical protein L484_021187 [Morus notabilis]